MFIFLKNVKTESGFDYIVILANTQHIYLFIY